MKFKHLAFLAAFMLPAPTLLAADTSLPPSLVKHGAPGDFDFEIGHWKTRLRRLTGPGGFSEGRGEFYSTDTLEGRDILVRFVISEVGHDSCHFEQAFSADGGKTWETNWIADDTRVP